MVTRDYRRERQQYYGYGPASSVTPEQQKHRREMAGRKKARSKMKKLGRVTKGQDVDHKNGRPTDNSSGNLRAVSVRYNRSQHKKK